MQGQGQGSSGMMVKSRASHICPVCPAQHVFRPAEKSYKSSGQDKLFQKGRRVTLLSSEIYVSEVESAAEKYA
jgi:hypothetical protein